MQEKIISKVETDKESEAMDLFNDVPWWLEEISSDEWSTEGGFWGLKEANETVPALFIAGVVIVGLGALINMFAGLIPALTVSGMVLLAFIFLPILKSRGDGTKFVVTHQWYGDNRIVTATRKTALGDKTIRKTYHRIQMTNHVTSFDRLLEDG